MNIAIHNVKMNITEIDIKNIYIYSLPLEKALKITIFYFY